MKFAYADPPYLGLAKYFPEHPEALIWDDPETHRELIARLERDWPDGWAMSLASVNLRAILPMCPPSARVAAWVKPFCAFKPTIRVGYTWEPVIFQGGRQKKDRTVWTIRDHLSQSVALGRGLNKGAKPEAFCRWVLDLLGYVDGEDTLDDLFPGTGVMGLICRQGVLPEITAL